MLAALVGVAAGVFIVVGSSTTGSEADDSPRKTKSQRSGKDKDRQKTPKEVVVEAGDSLSGIAVEYGVSVKRLERLNPDLDPNTLATGQTIKLR